MVLGADVRAVEIDLVREGISDTGANIGVTSYDVARFYNRPIMRFVNRLGIHGVGDSVLESTHYADFGQVLGKFALLGGRNVSTLISVSNITERGFTVEYSSLGVKILFEGVPVTCGRYDEVSRLWYLDIGELLLLGDVDKRQLLRCKRDGLVADWEPFTTACSYLSSERVLDQDDAKELVSKAPRKSRRGSVVPGWLVEAVFDLHNRLGHPSAKVMSMAIDHCMWVGVHPEITAAVINKVFEKRHCLACEIGKMKHLVTPVGSGIDEMAVADTISWDVCGKYNPPTIQGAAFMFVFVCCSTGFFRKFLTKNKTADTAERCLREVVLFFKLNGHTVRRIKFDRGSVENSSQIYAVLDELHIDPQPAATAKQRMNTVERYYQTFKARVGTNMACQTMLPATAWGHCAAAVEETMNCCPNELTFPCSPIELVTGKRPDVSRRFKFPFGCPLKCYDESSEGFSHGQLAISLGYGEGNGACNVIIPGNGLKSFERYDVAPLKMVFPTMSESEQREFEPIVEDDGSITIRSPVAKELGQDFIAYYDQRRTHKSHPSISPIDSATVSGTSLSNISSKFSDGEMQRQKSPAFAVLDEAQQILQRAWQSLTQLVSERESDLDPLSTIASSTILGGGGGATTASISGGATESEHSEITSSAPPATVPSTLSEEVSDASAGDGDGVAEISPIFAFPPSASLPPLPATNPASSSSSSPSSGHPNMTVEPPFIPTAGRRRQPRVDYTGQLEGMCAVAMRDRFLEMTEVRPPPLAFAFSARPRLTTADIQHSLRAPMVKQILGAHTRADRSFDENLNAALSPSASLTPIVELENVSTGRRAECLAQVHAARVARGKQQQGYDSDNPSLTRGLQDDPQNWERAIKIEFDDLIANNVGTPIDIKMVPEGKERQILNMMIILKVKRDAAGVYLKHKARVVVLGNQEIRSPNEKTFAPCASENSVLLLFSCFGSRAWPIVTWL